MLPLNLSCDTSETILFKYYAVPRGNIFVVSVVQLQLLSLIVPYVSIYSAY